MTLQDEQKPIDIAIANAMVACTPENWNSIILTLERQSDSISIGDFTHEIISPEGHPPVVPGESMGSGFAFGHLSGEFKLQVHHEFFERRLHVVSGS